MTNKDIINQVKKHKDTLCYNRSYIQEIQLDDKDGETEATLELYYSNDGYVYYIEYTNELNGKTEKIMGDRATQLAIELYAGKEPLIEQL